MPAKRSGLDYKAYLVKDGKIEYIDTVHTRQTATDLVNYWKKNRPIYNESFVAKKAPKEFAEQEREYWEEYDRTHKVPIQEYDPNALPFSG